MKRLFFFSAFCFFFFLLFLSNTRKRRHPLNTTWNPVTESQLCESNESALFQNLGKIVCLLSKFRYFNKYIYILSWNIYIYIYIYIYNDTDGTNWLTIILDSTFLDKLGEKFRNLFHITFYAHIPHVISINTKNVSCFYVTFMLRIRGMFEYF